MNTFYFTPTRIPTIRRAYLGRPEHEIEQAERAVFAYLDIALRVFEATDQFDSLTEA